MRRVINRNLLKTRCSSLYQMEAILSFQNQGEFKVTIQLNFAKKAFVSRWLNSRDVLQNLSWAWPVFLKFGRNDKVLSTIFYMNVHISMEMLLKDIMYFKLYYLVSEGQPWRLHPWSTTWSSKEAPAFQLSWYVY